MHDLPLRDFLPSGLTGSLTALADARTGLLTSTTPYAHAALPPHWLGWTSQVADTRGFSERRPWRADPYGFGASARGDEHACGASLGEAAERYCGNRVPANLLSASYTELHAAGRSALDPSKLALYSEDQYATAGFPFVPFGPELQTRWVLGTDVASQRPTYLPAPLVYLDYYRDERTDEAPVTALQYAGISAGRSITEAVVGGLLECVERDTTALWWFRRDVISEASDFAERTTVLGRLGLLEDTPEAPSVRVYSAANEWGVPVACALVRHPGRGLLTFGSAARPTFVAAAEKAVVEALAVAAISADLAEEDGPTRRSVRDGTLPKHLYAPHREDRAYQQDYPAPFRNMLDLPTVGQYYLDPCAQEALEKRCAETSAPASLAEVSLGDTTEAELTAALAERGAAFVDLTTPDVAAAGLVVVRVVVPGLYGNSPPAFPLLGGERMYRDLPHLPPFDLPLPLA